LFSELKPTADAVGYYRALLRSLNVWLTPWIWFAVGSLRCLTLPQPGWFFLDKMFAGRKVKK